MGKCFMLRKPISTDESSKKVKRNKTYCWGDAFAFFKKPKWAPPRGGADIGLGGRHRRIGSVSGPIYMTEGRTAASRRASGPLVRGGMVVPYVCLRELNMEENRRICAVVKPIYLVT